MSNRNECNINRRVIVWCVSALGAWVVLAAALLCFVALAGCASKGVKTQSVQSTSEGTTIEAAPPNTVTLTDPDGTWSATGSGPVKATEVGESGVTHVGNGAGRQIYVQVGDARIVMGSEADFKGIGLQVMDPDGNTIMRADELSTVTSTVQDAAARTLDALRPIVQAYVNGQRDVAVAELETQRALIDAAVPGLTDLLLKLIAPV